MSCVQKLKYKQFGHQWCHIAVTVESQQYFILYGNIFFKPEQKIPLQLNQFYLKHGKRKYKLKISLSHKFYQIG